MIKTSMNGPNPVEFNPAILASIGAERPCSPDILVGAYLVSHLQPRCENCGTPETPQWRKGWYSEILGRTVVLCNACGLKYNKNQFCPYCRYVYYKEEDKKAKHTWLSCDSCQRWVHIECERRFGQVKDLKMGQAYYCPSCRNEPQVHSVAGSSPPSTMVHGHHHLHFFADSDVHDPMVAAPNPSNPFGGNRTRFQ